MKRGTAMQLFLSSLISFPTVVYTVLLAVVIIYWLLAAVGLVDTDSSDIDTDIGDAGADAGGDVSAEGEIDIDADAGAQSHGGGLGGLLAALGLKDIPITIVLSVVILSSWTICCLSNMWLLEPLRPSLLYWIAGAAILAASGFVSFLVSSVILRPLRGLFRSHAAASKKTLVGSLCTVTTGSVDEQFGRADIETRGTSINVNVRAETPNTLARGSRAIIIEYDQKHDRYFVVPDED
ncbi:OB-fold-containig protein [Breznakiella homolactica]|uniref:DUF1449 family protein n=1 Tax=Breznakiella homolactica TaxID=2798577 RepID=A0A7T7XKU6_9SPIR|nr:OB-fold-containig protein [Breznakiella homolactica]QQO08093.1 DUF1449 family protein [Breznakiella homolactica]